MERAVALSVVVVDLPEHDEGGRLKDFAEHGVPERGVLVHALPQLAVRPAMLWNASSVYAYAAQVRLIALKGRAEPLERRFVVGHSG